MTKTTATNTKLFTWLTSIALFIAILAVLFPVPCATAPAQRTLSGVLAGEVRAGDYLVTGTLTVPPGRTLCLRPGAHLYFVNFAGLEVNGTLIAEGTPDSAIVLSSSPDHPDFRNRESAGAFDWNGVLINNTAPRVSMRHLVFAYSTYGFKIESDSADIVLQSVLFVLNGQFDVTRRGQVTLVPKNIPFNYNMRDAMARAAKKKLGESYTTSSSSTLNTTSLQPPAVNPIKLTAQIGLGAVCLGGVVMWIGGHLAAEDNYRRHESSVLPATVYKAQEDFNTSITVRNIGIVLAIVGAVGFSVTFIF